MKKLHHQPEIEEEIRNIAPGLSNLPRPQKKDDIPFRYFENLSDRVIQKLEDQKVETTPSSPQWIRVLIDWWYGKRTLVVSLASLLAVVLAGSLWWVTSNPNLEMDFSRIQPDEVRSYLISYASDLDDGQLNLLNDQLSEDEFLPISDEELEGVIDEYLYQIPSDSQLN